MTPENFLFSIISLCWQVIKSWWWIVLPFYLWGPLKNRYYYWVRERWIKKIKIIMIEIKIPRDSLKPIRAMEHIFAGFHAAHDIPTWREKWIEGVFQLSFSFEIASIDGDVRFYIRLPEKFRGFVESDIYSQFPEAEIFLVDDYTKNVPQDIPNKDWDMFGVDFVNSKNEIFPIKTYVDFETEREMKEEKRIDPLANLLEGLTTLKKGEQFWIQIIVTPVLGKDKPWQKKGRELADKLAKREGKPGVKSIFREGTKILIRGQKDEIAKKKETFPPEMRLTPGEKNVLKAVEEKLSKFGYDCNIRFLYLAKRDVIFKPRTKIGFSFYKEISTENLGGLKPMSKTMTKVKSVPFWFFDKRRLFLRKRKLFTSYIGRWSPFFPRSGGRFILNTEELATLYHFPSKISVPSSGVFRVEVKKSEPPKGLPIEEKEEK